MSRSIIDRFSRDIIDCFERGNKILIIGNGGSAAEAQHLSSELVGHFERDRKALPAIALTTDTSIITAVGNDDGYIDVFSRQIEALGKEGDILFVLSTSGKSKNCIRAEIEAYGKGMEIRHFPIKTDKQTTASMQEKHLKIIHEVCRKIDNYYSPEINVDGNRL